MKKILPNLKIGEKINGTLVEKVNPTDWIISFKGDLLRASNNSKHKLEAGETIPLIVLSTRPLRFRVNLE